MFRSRFWTPRFFDSRFWNESGASIGAAIGEILCHVRVMPSISADVDVKPSVIANVKVQPSVDGGVNA